MFFVPLYPGENRGKCLGEFHSGSVKIPRSSREFSQTLPRSSPPYEGAENMVSFFYKIIFRCNKEKDDTRSVKVDFNFFFMKL